MKFIKFNPNNLKLGMTVKHRDGSTSIFTENGTQEFPIRCTNEWGVVNSFTFEGLELEGRESPLDIVKMEA